MITITIFTEEDLVYSPKMGDEDIDKSDIIYNLKQNARFILSTTGVALYKKSDDSYIILKNRYPVLTDENKIFKKHFKL